MKKQIKDKKTASKDNDSILIKKSVNIWKIIAIVFIAVFALIIISGFFKARMYRPEFITASEIQIESARAIATNDLIKRIGDISGYDMHVSDKIRPIDPQGTNREIIEVTIYNQTVRHQYIIDIASGKIMMYSMTEFSDGLNHSIRDQRMNPHEKNKGSISGYILGFPRMTRPD